MAVQRRQAPTRARRGHEAAVDPPVRLAQLLVILKIALVVFVFYPPAADSFALPKSVVSHIGAMVLAAVLVALAIRDRRLFTVTPVHLAVLGLVGAFALSTVFAIDQTIALFGAWRRYLGLDQLIDHAVLFLGVATVFRTRADRGRLAFGLLAITAPVCLYGIVQWSGHDFVSYVETPGTHPVGTFGQPDTAGAFFGVVAACAFSAAAWPWGRWGIAVRCLAGSLAVVALGVGYATGTRGIYLALAGGLAGFVALLLVGRTRLHVGLTRAVVGVSGGAVVATLALVLFAPVLAPLFHGSGESRLEIWQTALRAVSERPLLGAGPDNFAAAYPALHDIRAAVLSPGELQNSTHDAPLYILTSAGVLGFLAWAAVVILGIARALEVGGSRDSDALVLVLIAAYLGQSLVTITDVGLEWMLFVAAGLSAASWAGRPLPVEDGRRHEWGALAVFGTIALSALVLLTQAQLSRLTASEAIADAEALRTNARPLAAIDYARQALQLDNRRAEHWGFFGTALQDVGNPGAARSAFEEATQRQPWNPLYWEDITLTYLAQNDEIHALANVDRAIAADPYRARSRDLAARLTFNKGDWNRALMEGAMAIRIDPTNLDEYEAPVRAAIHLQDWQQAESLLRTGLAQKETAHLHVLFALVYANSGRHADAVSEITRALALAPGDPEATQLQQQVGAP